MAPVGFGSSTVAAVAAPATSSSTVGYRRPRPGMLAFATRGGPAPAKEEKSLADFIFGAIFKKDQLVETDPLLNKVDGAPSAGSSASKARVGTKSGKKAAAGDDGESGGGFNLGGLFAKKG